MQDIPREIKNELIKNWGDKSDSMNCYTLIKFIDELSKWECFIYAIDPHDNDTIKCMINRPGIITELTDWTLSDLYKCYNSNGESPVIDTEFRKMRTAELFKKLMKK